LNLIFYFYLFRVKFNVRPIHSRADDVQRYIFTFPILFKSYTVYFIRVISATTSKMVSGLGRAMEITTDYLCRYIVYLCRYIVYLCRDIVYLCRYIVYLCRYIVYLCRYIVYLCRYIVYLWPTLSEHIQFICTSIRDSCVCAGLLSWYSAFVYLLDCWFSELSL
jgi:hypothetical protein